MLAQIDRVLFDRECAGQSDGDGPCVLVEADPNVWLSQTTLDIASLRGYRLTSPWRSVHHPRVTPAGFRRIALGLKDAVEQAHHGHPDFRVGGRVFATLGYPDKKWGAVMLTPDQQRGFVRDHADVLVPAAGAWGLQGSTTVRLDAIDEEVLGETLTLAWRNAVEKGPTRSAARKPRAAKRRAR